MSQAVGRERRSGLGQLETVGPDVGVGREPERDELDPPTRGSSSASRRPYGSPMLTAAAGGSASGSGSSEEPPLRLEVGLHRPVEVEVILRQVREHERTRSARSRAGAARTHARTPPSRSFDRPRRASRGTSRWRSIASGVVCCDGAALAPDAALDRAEQTRVAGRRRRASRRAGTPWSSSRSSP